MSGRATLPAIAVLTMTILVAVLAATLSKASPAGAGEITVTIDASPNTATNVVGSDHTIDAVVMVDGGPGGEGWPVVFNVTGGPNAGDSDSSTTDTNGETSFTYTGDGGLGQDTIQVCVESQVNAGVVIIVPSPLDCEEVTKDWVDPTPTPTATPTATPEPTPEPTPTATPTPDAAADIAGDTAVPAELPETGAQPASSDFPAAGLAVLALGGAAALAGGWALSRRTR